MLTDMYIKSLKPADKDYKSKSENGLYVLVRKNGKSDNEKQKCSKYLRFQYRFGGKQKLIAFGVWPQVSLAQARKLRDKARIQLADGIDPGAQKQAAKYAKADTFEFVFLEWLKQRGKKSESSDKRLLSLLKNRLLPYIGNKNIKSIKPPELLQVLRKIEDDGAIETAHRTKQYVSQIFRFAMATNQVDRDITVGLGIAMKKPTKKHFSAIVEPKKAGELMVAIDAYSCSPVVKAALKLSALFFCRPKELRYMKWNDVNWQEKRIELSAEKMKMREPHIIPLCTQAIEILKELHLLTWSGKYIFPSRKGDSCPISENTVRVALRTMGYDNDTMTAHGFRAMARTILDEVLEFPVHLIEHQLAHQVRDVNGTAYNRTKHLEKRREMMQKWADYLDELKLSAIHAHK